MTGHSRLTVEDILVFVLESHSDASLEEYLEEFEEQAMSLLYTAMMNKGIIEWMLC